MQTVDCIRCLDTLFGRQTHKRNSLVSAGLLSKYLQSPGWCQELGTPSGSPRRVAGVQACAPSCAAPQVYQAGSWLRSGVANTQTGTAPKWPPFLIRHTTLASSWYYFINLSFLGVFKLILLTFNQPLPKMTMTASSWSPCFWMCLTSICPSAATKVRV